jgi:fructosamine-3-kinase
MELFDAELKGLALLRGAHAKTPGPIGAGAFRIDDRSVLLFEALTERHGQDRTTGDWRSMGRALGQLHLVTGPRFGLGEFDGFFGPLPQDNRPTGTTWAEFYGERRLRPRLRDAVDSGALPHSVAEGVDAVLARLPALSGPDPRPTLLHGDAQQNNFVSTDAGAFLIDPAPYFGHPEADLALIDYFEPVPVAFFDGYRDRGVIDADFPGRRELWRLHAYLAGVVAEGLSPFGIRLVERIDQALRSYC